MGMDWAELASTPAAPAPEGMTSNLIDPKSRAWTVGLTIGITLPPAIILVVLRLYARLGLARKLGFDDYTCVLATIFTITFNALVLSVLDKPGGGAVGRHMWDVSLLRIAQYRWPSIIESVFSRISNTLIKVSLLSLYLRIFNPIPKLKWMIWVGLVVVVLFCVGAIIATLVLCIPRPGEHFNAATFTVPTRCTGELPKVITAGTVFSVISDIYILVIPIQVLPSLKLSHKRKAAVGSVFLVALLACAAGITNVVIRFDKYLPNDLSDFTWNVTNTYITKIAEINIGLLCSCMPVVSAVVLGPMRRLRALLGSWFGSSEPDEPESRGYRDPGHGIDNNLHQGLDISGETITGLPTFSRKAPDSRDTHGDTVTLRTLYTRDTSSTSQPILANPSDHASSKVEPAGV